MSDAPNYPPAPDYRGAADATAQGNLENQRAATTANRIDQYTPYGNQIYSQPDPNNIDKWKSVINLAPIAKDTLDSQLELSKQMGSLGLDRSSAVDQAFNKPYDMNSVQDIADKSYSNYTKRLDPQWAAASESQDAKLANQGIMQGSQAYDNAMREFNNAKNDAYTQANSQAISSMPQTYQLSESLRNQPLNELNAIRTGAQIQNPTFQAGGQQGYTPGPDLLGAAGMQNQYNMGLYNSGVGQANSFNSGLMNAAGSAASTMFF